jgi:hypothetical protein
MADAASWAAHATDVLALGRALVGYALLRGAPAALLERARSLRVWASGAMMSFALATFMRPGTALQWTAVVLGGAFAALLLLTFGGPVEAAESSNEQPARRDR